MTEQAERQMPGRTREEKRKELVSVLQVAWPAVVESFFIQLAGMVDTLMVSSINAEAVASVGLTTQPKFVGFATFFAMNIAVAALVARRKGEKNHRGANETLANAFVMTVTLGALISILCVRFADPVIHLCGSSADTHEGAVLYFKIIMGGMLFNVISMVINAAQRGSGNTKVSMRTNLIANALNVVLNYLLIGGHLGFPKLGIRGAAIATMSGAAVACVISIASLFRKDSFLSAPFIMKEKLWKQFGAVKNIVRLSSSSFVEQILMRIGFMATSLMAANMGTAAMAAHQVGMNALGLSFSLGDGMQAAAVTLIGQSLGEKKGEQAKRYGMTCEKVGLVLAISMSLAYFFFGKTLYRLFFDEAHIVSIGVGICRVIIFVVLFQICQVVFTGALRGAGDVVYTMITSSISVALVRTFVSYACCYWLGWGIYGIWMGIAADQFCRLIFGGTRFLSGKWMSIRI